MDLHRDLLDGLGEPVTLKSWSGLATDSLLSEVWAGKGIRL